MASCPSAQVILSSSMLHKVHIQITPKLPKAVAIPKKFQVYRREQEHHVWVTRWSPELTSHQLRLCWTHLDIICIDVFDRCIYDEQHVVYKVKVSNCLPFSTIEFNSKTTHNKGKVNPTYNQIKNFFEDLMIAPPLSFSVILRVRFLVYRVQGTTCGY
jgi:hypothetical protein